MFRLENKTDKSAKRDLFITVAGNVGAGKSTLTKLVGEKLDFETHFEKVDGNPYLEDFYKDQEAWGFHLQLYFLAQRFKQQKEIHANGLNNIQDRSIYEDVEIFARNLYDNGKMSKRDYITYRDLFNDMVPHLRKPDLMIYLDGSIDKIIERISKIELISKINFLEANNLELVDNTGKLIDIFSMSSLDIEKLEIWYIFRNYNKNLW